MDSVVWCHCADAHLGYKQYNLPQRLKDFGHAFDTCISLIIKQKPDFVVFAGDLFEHYNPNPPELRQAITILKKLKNLEENHREIPIYVISGNHDVSYSASKRYGGDILDFLQDLELIHYLKDSYEIVEKDGQPIALVAGLRFWGKKTPERLEAFCSENKNALARDDIPKILLLHAFLEGTVANYDITPYALNITPFDYIAIGHYHMKWPTNFTDQANKIFSSGATEHRTSAEWNHPRGFITVKAEKNGGKWAINPTFISYEVREKKLITKEFDLTTANEVIRVARELIKNNDKKEILLKLYLTGTLKRGEYSFINLQELKKLAKHALYVDIINHLTFTTIKLTETISDRDAYLEVLKNTFNVKKQYRDNYLALIENIIRIAEDRDFTQLATKLLDDFVEKNPDAIKMPEMGVEPQKAKPKPSTKRAKAVKKRRPSKKLDSFTSKGGNK
ncbi:MAG: metallophosphoesterase family protein [Candidatus Helarchaeota archaeon]